MRRAKRNFSRGLANPGPLFASGRSCPAPARGPGDPVPGIRGTRPKLLGYTLLHPTTEPLPLTPLFGSFARLALSPLLALAALAPDAHAQGPWLDLGNALPGGAGAPTLTGEGSLIGGTNYTLTLAGAPANSIAFLAIGQTSINAPFAGGVLVPALDVLIGPLPTGPAGTLEGTSKWSLGLSPGQKSYWQIWILDSTAADGWAASNALESTTPVQAGGTFPDDWIYGGDCANDPLIQVHRYNDDTYILRQSMCSSFEGPFMYLLFGEDKVLLEDTGAGGIPIASTVYGIIDDWLIENGKASIELIVAHTHGHGDHVQGDSQFAGQPNTTVVGTSQAAVAAFFNIDPWPTEFETYDLGARVLDVLAIPGHQTAHIALYDRSTGLLLTGDSLYPGFIFLNGFTWNQYRFSIDRLRNFAEGKPISWILGTHVEMTSTPFVAYPYGTSNQPEERDLQLEMKHLRELDDSLELLPTATTEVHADFIING